MSEILARLRRKPGVAVQILLASLLANILALASSLYVIQVLNRYVSYGVTTTLVTLTTGVILAIGFEWGFRRLRHRLAEDVCAGADHALGVGTFGLINTLRPGAFQSMPHGSQRELLLGLERSEQALSAANLTALLDMPFALIFLVVLFLISPPLAAIGLLFVVLTVLVGLAGQRMLRPLVERVRNLGARGQALMGASAASADTVRAFNASDTLVSHWSDHLAESQGLRRITGRLQATVQGVGQSGQALLSVAIIASGAILVLRGALDVGAMIGANILAARALAPMQRFAQLAEQLTQAREALIRTRSLAELEVEESSGSGLRAFTGHLSLSDLAYQPAGQPEPLFEGLSLEASPGAVIAVTGASGSGKTTLARMIAGLVEVERGRVLADGVDLRQVLPRWWRQQLIYLPQEPTFLPISLRENLAWTDPEPDDEVIAEALVLSGADAVVNRLPEGLETVMTGGGAWLSVGERRRLALARALVSRGSLAILDEPTEGLDDRGVRQMYEVMMALARRGCTILVCSHDARIISGAGWVLNLDHKPRPVVREQGGPAT
ncbi:MAG: ATP-binding cassette domain-containing protein [Gammaproteobacteria bacterium]